uniref:BPTI/Kunitz inhibitor domain-containing protein n=1 Tax=Accipiter nisus TaxID=211598 RepID=A0A8B9N7J2_9AVES
KDMKPHIYMGTVSQTGWSMLRSAFLAEDTMKQTNSIPVVLLLLCITGAALPPLKLRHSVCAMKADEGPCKAIHLRYYFNIQSRECEIFEYGGCHGNENNFLTLEECQKKCVVTGQYPFSYPLINWMLISLHFEVR